MQNDQNFVKTLNIVLGNCDKFYFTFKFEY
jgi:hypothetical protein